jgi:hypothetical protein
MANGDTPETDPLFQAFLDSKQTGKTSVKAAQDAAVTGYSPGSSWEQVEKAQNLTIYSKNNLFYFGQKGKPPVIEAIEVGDKIDVGNSWAYPIYTIDARGIQVKTLRYEPKKVEDATLFTSRKAGENAITQRGLLGTHEIEYQPKEDGYRIVAKKDPEVDRYPGTFSNMDEVNKFKQDNPEWRDYDVERESGTGRIMLTKPKAEVDIKDRYPGSFSTQAEAEQAKRTQDLTDYEAIRDPERGLWFLERIKQAAPQAGRFDSEAEAQDEADRLGLRGHTPTYDPNSGKFFLKAPEEEVTPGEVIQDPASGQWMIQQPDGSLRPFTPDYESEVVTQGGRKFVRDTSGNLHPLKREFQPGIIREGGREFLQQLGGEISELTRQFDPGVITRDGLQLLQQPGGQVSQTRAPNINEIIAQALIDGDFDKALAFQDFATRPTAKEAFDSALSYARSPADQQLVSSIARGETPVAPPPPGVVQRIGPQPDFLVKAYNEFQQRLRGGRPPTAEEQQQYMSRHRAGQTPLTDELQLQVQKQTEEAQLSRDKLQLQRDQFTQKQEDSNRTWELKLEELNQKMEVANRQYELDLNKQTGKTPIGDPIDIPSDGNDDTTGNDTDNGGTVTTANAPVSPGTEKYYDSKTKNWYVREIEDKPGEKTLNAQEQIEKNTADREAGFLEQTKDLNEELSAGIGPNGTGRFAGLVTSEQIQQWMRTAAQNAGASSSRYQETLFNALSSLAEPVHEQNVETIARQTAAAAPPTQAAIDLKARIDAGIESGLSFSKALAAAEADEGPPDDVITDVITDDPSGVPDVPDTPTPTSAQTQQTFEDITEGAVQQDIADEFTAYEGPGAGTGGGGWGWGAEDYAQGGMTHGKNLELVGERGPELVDLAPGSFVLPIKGLNQRQSQRIQQRGNVRGYQSGGIVFQDLPLGLRQQQAGRAITPPRGYLSQAAGLTLPSAQAFQNITPESREVFFDVAKQAGIPQGAFAQELRTAFPGGRRLPVSRMLPLGRRGVR